MVLSPISSVPDRSDSFRATNESKLKEVRSLADANAELRNELNTTDVRSKARVSFLENTIVTLQERMRAYQDEIQQQAKTVTELTVNHEHLAKENETLTEQITKLRNSRFSLDEDARSSIRDLMEENRRLQQLCRQAQTAAEGAARKAADESRLNTGLQENLKNATNEYQRNAKDAKAQAELQLKELSLQHRSQSENLSKQISELTLELQRIRAERDEMNALNLSTQGQMVARADTAENKYAILLKNYKKLESELNQMFSAQRSAASNAEKLQQQVRLLEQAKLLLQQEIQERVEIEREIRSKQLLLGDQNDNLKKEKEDLVYQLAQTSRQKSDLDAECRSQNLSIRDLNVQNEKLTKVLNDLTSRVEQQAADLESRARKKEALESELHNASSQLRLSLEARNALSEDLAREKKRSDETYSEFSDQIRALKSSLGAASEQHAHARDENAHLRDQNVQFRESVSDLKEQLEDLTSENGRLNTENVRTGEELAKLKEQQRLLIEKNKGLQLQADELQRVIPEKQTLAEQYAELETQHRRVLASRAEIQKDLQATKVRLQNTEEARYVTESRREVLEDKLTQVTEKLEESEKKASTLTSKLKRNEQELADLTRDMEALKDREANTVKELALVVQAFNDHKREAQKRARELASTIESQEELLEQKARENKSLSVDLIKMTEQNHVLGARNTEQKQQIDKLETVSTQLQEDLMAEQRKKKDFENQAHGLAEQKESLSSNLSDTQERLELANRKLRQLSDALTAETKSKTDMIDDMKSELEDMSRKHTAQVEIMAQGHREQLNELNSSIARCRNDATVQEEAVAELQSKIQGLNKNKSALQHQLQQLNEELDSRSNTNLSLTEQLRHSQERVVEQDEQLEITRQKVVKLTSDAEQLREKQGNQYQSLFAQKQELEAENATLESQLDAARVDMQRIQKEWLQTTQQRDQFQKERLEALSRKQESEDKWHEDHLQLERSKTKLAGEKGMLERDLARITEKLREVETQRVRVQKDLDDSLAEAEKHRSMYLNERSAMNELQDQLQEAMSARERTQAELEALQRSKKSIDSESSGLRREFEEMEHRNRNLNTEIQAVKKELHSAQVRLSEHELGYRQSLEQAKTAQAMVTQKERIIEEMKTTRVSEKRAAQFLKAELEQSISELQQQVGDLTRRKDETESKNRELQSNLKQLYVQVKEEMEKLKNQTKDSDEILTNEKMRAASIAKELKEELARQHEHANRSINMLEQENERLHMQMKEREKELEEHFQAERDIQKRQFAELREQHNQALDRSMRSAHQSESTVLSQLEEERRQSRLLSHERDEGQQALAQLRAETAGLKREQARYVEQIRKLEESKMQHTTTITKLMTANKELQRLIEHTRNDLDFIRRVEDLKRDQEQYEQSTANLQSFITSDNARSFTNDNMRPPATPSASRSPPRRLVSQTPRATGNYSISRETDRSLTSNTRNISPIRERASNSLAFRTGLSRSDIATPSPHRTGGGYVNTTL